MKRVLSLVLSLALLLGSIPMVISAATPNDFQTNFSINTQPDAWSDANGQEHNTVKVDYQLKGTGLSGPQGAWIAVDLNKFTWVHNTKNGESIFDKVTLVPGAAPVQVSNKNYYKLKDTVTDEDSGEDVDAWTPTLNLICAVALSADGETLYIGTYPMQTLSVTYNELTTVMSFRFAVLPGASLESDSIRFINAEEQVVLNQSYVFGMNDGNKGYYYGSTTEPDTLAAMPFTGNAGITGVPTVHAVAPVITVPPVGADYYLDVAATPLTVSATVSDGGILSYAWYRNNTGSITDGELVSTGASCPIATNAISDAYYYVVVTNTNLFVNGNTTASVTSTPVRVTVSKDPDITTLENAKAILESAAALTVNQADCPTANDVRNYVHSELSKLVAGLDLVVTPITYIPSSPGTSANPTGTTGTYIYTVTITRNGKSLTTEQLTAQVAAVWYDGVTDEQAAQIAKDKLLNASWDSLPQIGAESIDAITAALTEQAKGIVGNAAATVSVSVTSVSYAQAGSASTSHGGESGWAIFDVTVGVGAHTHTVGAQNVSIIPTYYNGQLNSEALTVATNTLNVIEWADIAQTTANTEADVIALIEALAKAAIAEANASFTDPVPVTVTVNVNSFTAAVAGSPATGHTGIPGGVAFTVTATVAGDSYTTTEKSFDIIATEYNGQLNSEALTVATNTLNIIDWADIAQTTANTEADVIALIEALAKAAIAEANANFTDPVPVDVTVDVKDFTAAVAGSPATGHTGIPGSVAFTVTATVAGDSYTTAEKSFDIIATEYNGQLNSEALTVATNTLNVIEWADIAQTTANTEEDVIALIETLAKAAIAEANASFTDPVPVTVTVNVNSFTAAQAGSPATGHTGIPGSVAFTVTATVAETPYTTAEKSFDIIATEYKGQLNSEALTVATNTLNVIEWADIAQTTANTEADVIALIETLAKAAIAEANASFTDPVPVDVTVDVKDFTAAQAGSPATGHTGIPGSVAFTVTATVAGDSYTTTEKSFDIIATEYNGQLNSEALTVATNTLNVIEWADIAQTTANTEADVIALIETLAKAAIAEANASFTDPVPVDVTVDVKDFTAAQAGSPATGHTGIPGSVAFTVTATVAGDSYTTGEKSFDIIATEYTGQLNSEALTVATNTLNVIEWADIAQTTANTEADVIALIETLAKAAIAEANASFTDPVPVTVTVNVNSFTAAVAGSPATGHTGIPGSVAFTVTATVAGDSYTTGEESFDIIATEYNGQLNSEALTVATDTLNVIDWADIAQTTANTEADVIVLIETLAKAAIAEANATFTDPVPVTVTVNVNSFTAAVAGSPATGHTGIPGSVAFTVTATVAGDSYTTGEESFDIIATEYNGQLNSEALTVATNALNGIVWEDIIQATANTENAVIAEITKIANAAIAKANEGVNTPVPVDVTVDVTEFTAAQAGSASVGHDGIAGIVKFTVTATVAGTPYTTAEKTFDITATPYAGQLNSEALTVATNTLNGIVWEDIIQATANTENAVIAEITKIANAAIAKANEGVNTPVPVDVTVDVTEFTAAVAGSSSTSREGRVGSVAFTVTATVAGDSYTTGEKSFDIIATEYTGVMDNEAVDAAKDVLDALTETTVTVKIGATADEILAYVKAHLQSFMDGDATGVTVSVTAGTNGQYTATLTKGNKSVQTTVTLTVEEEDPIKLDAPDGLSFNQGVASWNAVEHAVSYTVRLYVVNDDTEELFMTEVVTAAQIDFSEYLEEDTSYVFDVIAHGDGIYYVDSNVSENSNVYTVNKSLTPEQIAMILLMLRRSRVEIRAEAGEGGSITDAGVKSFRRGNNVTYRFTPDEGYAIDTVIVDGQSIGAVEEYTFRNVQDAHSILVVFKLAKWQNPFTDVSELNSYYDAVRFVYERGLFEGVSKTEFAPAASMTRAMFVTVLWRLEGMPVVDYAMQYSDVEENTWYTDAIRWASAQGIVEGYGDGIYGTNDAVTVEQAAVIMARYAQHAGKYQAGSAHLGAFADHADVAAWAAEAMQWSVSNGIYMGTAGKLQPAKEAPRSLAAEWMYEYTVRFGN